MIWWFVPTFMLFKRILLLALALTAKPVQADEPRIEIVCSFSVLEDWCSKMLKGNGLTKSLVPLNGEIHEFQLSVQDVVKLRRASLVIGFSPESETWLEDWAKANPKHRIIWLGVNEDGTRMPAHAWTDPVLVMTMVRRLCEALTRFDSDIHPSADQMVADVEDVDSRLKSLFAALPMERRKFVSQHPNLNPLADRYGLRVVGTLVASASGEAADTSAHHFSGLLRSISSEGVRVIVADAGHNHEMARRLAMDAKIPPPIVLNLESLSPPGGPASTWKDMMLHHGTLLQRALMNR